MILFGNNSILGLLVSFLLLSCSSEKDKENDPNETDRELTGACYYNFDLRPENGLDLDPFTADVCRDQNFSKLDCNSRKDSRFEPSKQCKSVAICTIDLGPSHNLGEVTTHLVEESKKQEFEAWCKAVQNSLEE